VRRAVVHVNIDPAGALTLDELARGVGVLRGAGYEVIDTDLESYPATEREIEVLLDGDAVSELRGEAERACVEALAGFAPPERPCAVAVTFISSGSHEDALGIVRGFGLEDQIEEVEFVDENVAVLVLAGNGNGVRRSTLAKLQTVLEAALNREVEIVEP
jgi:hypothetical protein